MRLSEDTGPFKEIKPDFPGSVRGLASIRVEWKRRVAALTTRPLFIFATNRKLQTHVETCVNVNLHYFPKPQILTDCLTLLPQHHWPIKHVIIYTNKNCLDVNSNAPVV